MRFDDYCQAKESEALRAVLPPYKTVSAEHRPDDAEIGSEWTRRIFDGPFYRASRPPAPSLPIVNLVFVQSADGNTVVPNPSTLGGGDVDKHVIYEGLSRVDADAVMAGAATARAENMMFSVWHPELVALRRRLGLPRHPAQVVISISGALPFERGLMFRTPELRVFVVTSTFGAIAIRAMVESRPWIEVIDAGDQLSITAAMSELRARGVRTVSCVGGPMTATSLLREQLVSDVYLTTSPRPGGVPGTPYYRGPAIPMARLVEKAGQGAEEGVRFEHFRVER
jgi:riboflavin biosynthesis pyrimidine reductase